ncbi:hypothetical protein [Bradyrhizobium valentinum]|nr:hypothetical protein [Bradyrhizobium valentinum]
MLDAADIFRERIERAIEKALAAVDPTSPRAEDCRAALRQIRATLPECSLPQLMKVAALDAGMHGAIFKMIEVTLGIVGPPPLMLDVPSASAMLDIFTPMIEQVRKIQLH